MHASRCSLSIAIALFTPILWVSPNLAQVAPVPLTRFRDTQTHWAAACIEGIGSQGLVQGFPDRSFRPDGTMTRAEFATVMMKAFVNAPKIRSAPKFPDVPQRFWAAKAINQAYERGFLAGYPGNLIRPTQPITRAQALTVLANAQELRSGEEPDTILRRYFEDQAEIPRYARPGIAASAEANLIVNYPALKQLRPNANIARGEIAALLCQVRLDGSDIRYRVPPQYVVSAINHWRDRLAFPPELKISGPFSGELAPIELGFEAAGLPVYGYVNQTGKVVLPGPYRQAERFQDGLAAVQQPGTPGTELWGWIDRTGRWTIQPQFRRVHPFVDGVALVSREDQSSEFIDPQGKTVLTVPPNVSLTTAFSEGLVAFSPPQGRWGFMDKQGAIIIPAQFDEVEPFSEGLARVNLNGKFGFVNRAGTVVIPIEHAEAQSFRQGLAAARSTLSAPWGYLDQKGNWAISPQFRQVQSFSEGLAGAVGGQNPHWGFIDRTGKFIISPQFYSPAVSENNQPWKPDGVQPFSEGFAAVRLGTRAGLINREGQWRLHPKDFDNLLNFVGPVVEGMAPVEMGWPWLPEGQNSASKYPTPRDLFGGGTGYMQIISDG